MVADQLSRDAGARTGVDYQARDVTKTFAGIAVLRDVTVHFRPGEIHSLIGENGAGKSTLLKIMAGVYPADPGELVLGGEDAAAAHPEGRAAARHLPGAAGAAR